MTLNWLESYSESKKYIKVDKQNTFFKTLYTLCSSGAHFGSFVNLNRHKCIFINVNV